MVYGYLVYYMQKKQMNIVLSDSMLEGIDRAIELGYSMNRSDFIRTAIGNTLKDLSIITEMKQKKLKKEN